MTSVIILNVVLLKASFPMSATAVDLEVNPEVNLETEAARRVAAVCRHPEAETVRAQVAAAVPHPTHADVLWLTWVQWRALGRDLMVRETGLSLWTLTERLRQLREAGAPVLSSSEERDLIARGRFHGEWA